MFFHSSSFTANPIACAAANANLAIWREEPVQERIESLARRERDGFARLAERHPVRNLRQCGTVSAFDLEVEDAGYLSHLGPKLLASFRDRDILLRPLGNTIYVMPPYCISDEDLEMVLAAIDAALDIVLREA